jgi:hypothetical protein
LSEPTQSTFTDDEMRIVLARAIELDGHHVLNLDQLRTIATEIGVSEAALARAIREDAMIRSRTDAEGRGSIFARRLVALGVPTGAIAGAFMSSGPPIAVVGVMVVGLAVSGALALYESESGTLRSFQLKNVALWGGALAGSIASATLLSGSGDRAPLLLAGAWCVRGAITSAILGSATMLAAHRARRGANVQSDPPSSAPTTATGRTPVSRLLSRLRSAVHEIVRPVRVSTGTRAPAA